VLWSWATFCERPVTTTPRRRNDRATSPNGHVLTGDLRDGLLGAVAACELDGLHMYSSWPRSWACSPSSRGVRLDLRALPRRLGGPRDGRDVDRRGENEAEERLVTRASYVERLSLLHDFRRGRFRAGFAFVEDDVDQRKAICFLGTLDLLGHRLDSGLERVVFPL
jgi:hypothetical protein